MNKSFLPLLEEDFFSDLTHQNNYDQDCLNNSCQDSNETNLSINNTTNYICQNITLNISKNKKSSASFCVNLMKEQAKPNCTISNNYTQNIILHSLNSLKNKDINLYNKIEISKGVQHIVLKSLKKNKQKNNKISNNDNNENFNNNDINNNDDIINNNIKLNSNNIIRVIFSSEKMLKNFPMEYIKEMITDLCINLYNSDFSLEKIMIKQSHLINNQQKNFFQIRMSLFNFILDLTLNSHIKESTLFLTYIIFDRYISIQPTNYDELLLIIITSFALAIKYIESNVPNLEELCNICEKKFNKEQINKCELNIMEKLNYNISIPTIFDLFQFIKVIKNMNSKEYNFGLFIMEMFIIEGWSLKYNPLIVIEAIYLLILETNGKEKKNLNLYNYMSSSVINTREYNEEINKCLSDIKNVCLHIKENNFSCLIKKFAKEKYQKISVDFQLI